MLLSVAAKSRNAMMANLLAQEVIRVLSRHLQLNLRKLDVNSFKCCHPWDTVEIDPIKHFRLIKSTKSFNLVVQHWGRKN